MTRYRKNTRTDKNQKAIVDELRSMGFSVVVDHDDILVGYRGFTFWYEIKEPETVSKKTGKIRSNAIKDNQKLLLQTYRGHYQIVWNVQQILDDIRKNAHVTSSQSG